MFTALVTKILAAIVKKAASLAGLKALANGFTVLSWFETARSLHECTEVPRCIVEVGYEILADSAVDELVDRVIDNRFNVHRTDAGLYVASAKPILQPRIVYPDLADWRKSGFSEDFASRWQQTSANFDASVEERRKAFEIDLARRRWN